MKTNSDQQKIFLALRISAVAGFMDFIKDKLIN